MYLTFGRGAEQGLQVWWEAIALSNQRGCQRGYPPHAVGRQSSPSVRSLLVHGYAGARRQCAYELNIRKAVELSSPQPRTRFNSDASTRGILPGSVKAHHRNSSALSFGGLDSFAEIRQGFEFSDSCPGFYSPPTTSRHDKRESMLSIASVSSYGHLVHSGSSDPLDYAFLALPLKQQPWSDDFSSSMSTSVDDTFSFIHRLPRRK